MAASPAAAKLVIFISTAAANHGRRKAIRNRCNSRAAWASTDQLPERQRVGAAAPSFPRPPPPFTGAVASCASSCSLAYLLMPRSWFRYLADPDSPLDPALRPSVAVCFVAARGPKELEEEQARAGLRRTML